MASPSRYEVILRLNLALTVVEGIWAFWQFLKSPSETSSVVFLQYSPGRLFLLLIVLVLLAGNVFLLGQVFRVDWPDRIAGRWLQAVLQRKVTFWLLFTCAAVMYVFVFMSGRVPGGFLPYRERILPMFVWGGISSMHWLVSWLFLQWKDPRYLQSLAATLRTMGLIIVFFLSRAVYDRLGFTFQSEGIHDYWQMIDPFLLHTDLWRSLLHLHSQPPMLNLSTGLILQFFPSAHDGVFHALYLLAGLVLAWSVYRLGLGLGLPAGPALAVSMLFTISPPVVLYEHWLFYTYPVTSALTLAGVALHQFQITLKFGWGFLFFSLLAFVALSWSLFHLTWLIAIISMLLCLHPNRRMVFLAALLPLILVISWYAKNYILFREFTASTWAGMNLSHPTTLRLPDRERLLMVETGELSPFARYSTFSAPGDYLNLLPDTPITGIPLLDNSTKSNGRINFHHLVFVETSKYYRHDALRVIRSHPTLYLRSISQSLYIFFHSTSDYDFLDHNRGRIPAFELMWNRLFFGQWQMNETLHERTGIISVRHVGWWILTAFLIALFGAARHLWHQRRALKDPGNLVILFMGLNLMYLMLVGTLLDLGENNRFRFVVDPFILMLFLFVVVNGVRAIRVKIRPALE